MTETFDHINRAIIAQLQQDGRRPYSEIAKEVGLSEAAVRQRVKKLTASGALQIIAVTDEIQLGHRQLAMVSLTVDGPVEPVLQTMAPMPEVVFLACTAGNIDILAEVAAIDHDELYRIVSTIRAIPTVRSCETYVYFAIHKRGYHRVAQD